MTLRRLPLLLLLAAASLPLARVAWADDGDAPKRRPAEGAKVDSVAQLTPQELAFLRSRIQGWDGLEEAKRQLIARNVLRIRSLKPEQREAFEKKLGHLRRGEGPGSRPFGDHATRFLVNRALAEQALAELGKPFAEAMRRRDISSHAFEMAFSMAFWQQLAESLAARGEPPAPDALPEDFPGRHRGRYAKAYAEYAKGGDPKRREGQVRRLWLHVAMTKGEQVRVRLQRTDLKGDAYVAAVGAAVRKEYGEVFQQTLAEPDKLLEAAERVEVKRSLRRLVQRTGRLDRDESALLVTLLGRLASENLKGEPSAAEADAALKLVLVRELRVAPEDLAKMPPAEDAEARAAFLRELLAKRLGRGYGPPSRARGGPPPWERGRPPERPEGVSDEDWKILLQHLEAQRAGGGRPSLREKPEGMSEEGWRRIREALAKRFGERRRGH